MRDKTRNVKNFAPKFPQAISHLNTYRPRFQKSLF